MIVMMMKMIVVVIVISVARSNRDRFMMNMTVK